VCGGLEALADVCADCVFWENLFFYCSANKRSASALVMNQIDECAI